MKKAICKIFAAASLTAMLLLSACGGDEPETTQAQTQAQPDATTAAAAASANLLPLVTDGKPAFCFVYQKKDLPYGMTAYNYSKIANNIAIGWKQKTGVEFPVYSEEKLPEEHPALIVVGNVRGLSGDAFDGMRLNDFSIVYDGSGFVLAALSKDTVDILEGRMDAMLTEKDGAFYLDADKTGEAHRERYRLGSVTVGGSPLEGGCIVCGELEKEFAGELRDLLIENAGIAVPVVSEKSGGCAITLKSDASVPGYEIGADGSVMSVVYNPGIPERLLAAYLEESFSKQARGTDLELASLSSVYRPDWDRTIMTYNVLDVYTKNGSPAPRDGIAASMILDYLPDILCLQEFDPGYRNAKDGLAGKISGDYSEVSVEGVAPDSIWNPVFYRKDRFEQLKSGFRNMRTEAGAVESTTYFGDPDGYSSFRTLVWAVLRDKTDGTVFVIGNTHCSVKNPTHAKEAEFIHGVVSELAKEYPGCVTFVTGDLNSARNSSAGAVAQLCGRGFSDTYDSAGIRTDGASYHELGSAPAGTYMSNGIDHILTLGGIEPKVYMNVERSSLLNASDHLPVILGYVKR